MTGPVRPPSDIRLQCTDHPELEFNNNWTEPWNHQLDEHGGVSPNWLLLGTVPE